MAENSFIEVDLRAIRHNLNILRELLSPGVQQLAVVKADAYGHGVLPVTRAIRDKVDWLAVNDVDEGIELREAGIDDLPILVFGVPTADTAAAYEAHNLTATVSAIDHFDLLPGGSRYHLNFDTGMGRLGFLPGEVEQVKSKIQNHPELECGGIYSHFATADDPGSGIAENQLERFKHIRSQFGEGLITHMGHTGATAFYPDSHFDMVRNGIGIYGYAPGATLIGDLVPALKWKSHLVQVKPVEKGQTVSYGARWVCRENGYIGVIPIGYEEGIPRILSGYLEVGINSVRYPVIGTVTMNFVMVFLKEMKLEPGQAVDIMGDTALNAGEWANRADTIPYEILTGLSDRIERRYINE